MRNDHHIKKRIITRSISPSKRKRKYKWQVTFLFIIIKTTLDRVGSFWNFMPIAFVNYTFENFRIFSHSLFDVFFSIFPIRIVNQSFFIRWYIIVLPPYLGPVTLSFSMGVGRATNFIFPRVSTDNIIIVVPRRLVTIFHRRRVNFYNFFNISLVSSQGVVNVFIHFFQWIHSLFSIWFKSLFTFLSKKMIKRSRRHVSLIKVCC